MNFKIGEFAKIAQVSIRLLRYYDEIGLFAPAFLDTESSYRYYTLEQLPCLHRILALKDLGLSLSQVEKLVNENPSMGEIRGMLRLRQAQLEETLEAVQAQLIQVQERMKLVERLGEFSDNQVVLKSAPALTILSLHEDITPPRRALHMFRESLPVVRERGYAIRGFMTRYHLQYLAQEGQRKREAPYPTEAVYILDSTLQTNVELLDGKRLVESELPPVELMASIIHVGDDLIRHHAHRWLLEWTVSNGYCLAGPTREVYLHRSNVNPEANVTEIQLPLRRV